MIKNFIKIALRDLWKHKRLTAINIIGLSLGLACFILFLLYTLNELTYDRFHTEADKIYRVYRYTESMRGELSEGDPYLPIPLGPAMKSDFPDVESMVRMRGAWDENFVRVQGQTSRLGISFADSNFFNFFSFNILYGNQQSPLHELNNIVLPESIALRLFGEKNPVGRSMEIQLGNQFETFIVSAVTEDMPSNTSIPFKALCTFEKLKSLPRMERRWTNWGHSSYFTFIKLRNGSALALDRSRMDQFRKKYYPNEEQELRADGTWKGTGTPVTYKLQPIKKIHTQPEVWGGILPAINPTNSWILLGIAFAILIIACINFTTLSIGRSAGRSREIGVRKVMGSNRTGLVSQFLTESLLLTVFSAGLGLAAVYSLLPVFNKISDRHLVFSFDQFPEMIWMLGFLIVLTGIVAGLYPAMILSGFRPVEVLKNKIKLGGSNIFTRSLVTIQFTVSIGLIISTVIILKQIDYMISKNPGFNKDHVVILDAEGTDSKRILKLLSQKLKSIPGVIGISGSELGLGAEGGWSRQEWDYNGVQYQAYEYFVDPHYLDVMNITLLSGRNFLPDFSQDTLSSVIINETMMKKMKWTLETALGQKLVNYHGEASQNHPTVIGVVKDFNFRSMAVAIGPQLFHQFSSYAPFKFFIRIRPTDQAETLKAIGSAWTEVEPVFPFKYSFLDDDLAAFYNSEKRLGQIISWAGGISIFLACLGLFGLTALTVVNRRKEIGIRKIIGATVFDITSIVSKEFVSLIIIGIGIAIPTAYYFMNKWLNNFENRVSIGWWVYLLTAILVISVSIFTICIQSLRAASENPVKSLRTE